MRMTCDSRRWCNKRLTHELPTTRHRPPAPPHHPPTSQPNIQPTNEAVRVFTHAICTLKLSTYIYFWPLTTTPSSTTTTLLSSKRNLVSSANAWLDTSNISEKLLRKAHTHFCSLVMSFCGLFFSRPPNHYHCPLQVFLISRAF